MISWQEAPKAWQETSKNLTGNVGLPFSAAALDNVVSVLHPETVYMKVGAAITGSTAIASEVSWARYPASTDWAMQKILASFNHANRKKYTIPSARAHNAYLSIAGER